MAMLITGGHLDPAARQAPPARPAELGRSRVRRDLAAIDRDTYLMADTTDHLCPWKSSYRSTQVLSGSKRFVLSTSGHIAAMVNPPGNDKARYQVAKNAAPEELGGGGLEPIGDAPGTYVYDR
jgi:polyhydroxyalkanoate synthase subunit PhaC